MQRPQLCPLFLRPLGLHWKVMSMLLTYTHRFIFLTFACIVCVYVFPGDISEGENGKLNTARHAFSCSMRYEVLYFIFICETYRSRSNTQNFIFVVCWCDSATVQQVFDHENRVVSYLGPFCVEQFDYHDMLLCNVVENGGCRRCNHNEPKEVVSK